MKLIIEVCKKDKSIIMPDKLVYDDSSPDAEPTTVKPSISEQVKYQYQHQEEKVWTEHKTFTSITEMKKWFFNPRTKLKKCFIREHVHDAVDFLGNTSCRVNVKDGDTGTIIIGENLRNYFLSLGNEDSTELEKKTARDNLTNKINEAIAKTEEMNNKKLFNK